MADLTAAAPLEDRVDHEAKEPDISGKAALFKRYRKVDRFELPDPNRTPQVD